jgi:hypothetical protein
MPNLGKIDRTRLQTAVKLAAGVAGRVDKIIAEKREICCCFKFQQSVPEKDK